MTKLGIWTARASITLAEALRDAIPGAKAMSSHFTGQGSFEKNRSYVVARSALALRQEASAALRPATSARSSD